MAKKREVYILAARRTPFGKFWGAFKDISAPKLASPVLQQLTRDVKTVGSIDGVYMGEVLTAGVGQNPARQAREYAGLHNGLDDRTFNKVCSSSLIAMDHATDKIRLGDVELIIAGGMESMSQAPYLLRRWGKTAGDLPGVPGAAVTPKSNDPGEVLLIDSMLYDGLRDIYDVDLPHMGKLADMCARDWKISRDEQEAYAYVSFKRALEAQRNGWLNSQIVPVATEQGNIDVDEGVYEPDMARWKRSKPAFTEGGTVTAGTSSQISDGAAAMVLASGAMTKKLNFKPLARVVAFAVYSGDPKWFTTAPAGAIELVCKKAQIPQEDIDLFEINEAFAVVPLFAMLARNIPHEKLNIWGGAIAFGHPIGASGARITISLTYQLIETRGRYGIAVACNGGGEAVAVLIENMQRNRKA